MSKLFQVTAETTLPKIMKEFCDQYCNKKLVEAIIEYCADELNSDFENQLIAALQKFKTDNE
jgi:hypothetical protein